MRIVITGANRGIGLEFARQYLARGEEVEAAVRRPVLKLDELTRQSIVAVNEAADLYIFVLGRDGA